MGPTDLVGRSRELDELDRRLAGQRLVTVVGPGGIGKTTLARVATARAGPRYALGPHVVDLTRVDDADAVAGTLAAQLGFPSFEALLASPGDQPALILLDNCEHVLDAAAAMVDELLGVCAAPTVLATSRSPLDVPGEAVVVLGPLRVPPRGYEDAGSPALELFRRRAADAGGEVGDDQLEVVAELCRALDGVPLALEIAAARSRTMTPTEILARLGDLDLLARPRHRGRERHRSLRATIEWSYDQLDEGDRSFFDRLAVFAGAFTAEAAHEVAAADGRSPSATADQLQRLVDASLLVTEPVGSVTRFRQLASLRTFARERLEARGAWDATWERFVDHVTDWSVAVAVAAAERWDASLLGGLLARYESHLAALRWCVERDPTPERCFTLLTTLWGVVHQGHAAEVDRWARRALDRWPDPAVAGWADAAATAATCRYLLGDPDGAVALARTALAGSPPSPFSPVTLRRVVAQAHAARGELEEALAAVDEAIDEARHRVPSLAMELDVLRAELAANPPAAGAPIEAGAVAESLARVRAVQVEAVAADSELNEVWARSVEGSLLSRIDPVAAVAVATDALRRSRALAYPACEAVNLHTLATVALDTGDLAGAAARLLDLVEHLVARAAETELRTALQTAAAILHAGGSPAWESLAATAATLPVVSIFVVPGHERRRLPATTAPPVLRRDAVDLARRELRVLADPTPTPDTVSVVLEARPGGNPVTDRSTPHGRLVRSGDVWELTWDDRTVTLRHAKGFDDLAHLLVAAGREIHCLDLAGAGAEQASTGPVVDDAARAGYERRIRDLQEELEEAEAVNDPVRAERARLELDTVVDHLSAAMGLGGAGRRTGGTAERARSTVTQRVRATIRRIGRAHPALGRHLDASVRTGTFCSYRPERPTTWHVG